MYTFRVGLLARAAWETVCLIETSAGVSGDGKALSTLASQEAFSWELGCSGASLLGTGVTVPRLGFARELPLVSFRQEEAGASLARAADGGVEADLVKKLKMFCCLPPEVETSFLDAGGA
jgi:hypothetical protein